MVFSLLNSLPELWKVQAIFEALCMGNVERMSCYRELVRDGEIE